MHGGCVSVIVPTDRVSPHLRTALRSVAQQTYDDWEVVMVSDGCPDPDALERLLDEEVPGRFRLVRQPRLGVSAARNVGAVHARGPLLVFLDDDDFFVAERFARQVDELVLHPDCGVGYSGGAHVDAAGHRVGGWAAYEFDQLAMLAGAVPIPRIQTMMFRADVFAELGGFNSAIRYCQDHDLTLRALQLTAFCAVDAELAAYRRYPDNHTALPAVDILRAGENIVRFQAVSAAQRHDLVVAAALFANLHALRRRGAAQCGADAVVALGAGDLSLWWRSSTWGTSRGPASFLTSAARRTGGFALRRIGARGRVPASSTASPLHR